LPTDKGLYVSYAPLGSRDEPAENGDGTTDVYLGPKAPAGKEGNWLATVPGKGYFAILRLYGPTEAAINKSWKPRNIEKVKSADSRFDRKEKYHERPVCYSARPASSRVRDCR
jgi:Protein of unknown function (DUF1214)